MPSWILNGNEIHIFMILRIETNTSLSSEIGVYIKILEGSYSFKNKNKM